MSDPRTLLVAADASACSRRALHLGGRLAARSGATLHVLQVIDEDAMEDLVSAVPRPRAELEKQVLTDARSRLDAAVKADCPGASAEVHLQVGHPLDVILTTADQVQADLLILGTHGKHGPGRGAGTLAIKCARRSPRHVLLVHESRANTMKVVLACVDFSSYSDDVAGEAARLATVDDARLHLLHVYHNPFDAVRWGIPIVDTSGQYDRHVAGLGERLEALRQRIAATHPTLQIECDLLFGLDYGRTIVAHTGTLDADLAVLGAKGRTNLSYVLLGSTAERVLRETNTSVLTVKMSPTVIAKS